MKKSFVLTLILFVSFVTTDLFAQTNDSIYYTLSTSGVYANYWCRIASMEFTYGYQDFGNTVEIFANGSSTPKTFWGKLIVRSKRQDPDPNGPPTNFQMHLYDSNLGADNIQAVQNNNVVDIYVRIPSTWTRMYFRSLIRGNSTFQFYSNQPFIQHLPSADSYYSCNEGKLISELIVAKNIETTEVKVNQSYWPDYVFDENYRLKPLDEIDNFIQNHGHLPDIPSAKEVEENGISLGEMDAKLLQKIEELTLYVIELQKKYDDLKNQYDAISNQ
ncbi:MAG: hypothetical protein MI975_09365 [Cytophagales bacterium]|nr:hypothetical protein [Cytophagales bacterium]